MVASYGFLTAMGWQRPLSMPAWGPLSPLRLYHCLGVIYAIVQIGDGGLYWDFKVRVLFEKASRRQAFLMHKGFVIPVKSDVEYLN